jgi:hypothetical protein
MKLASVGPEQQDLDLKINSFYPAAPQSANLTTTLSFCRRHGLQVLTATGQHRLPYARRGLNLHGHKVMQVKEALCEFVGKLSTPITMTTRRRRQQRVPNACNYNDPAGRMADRVILEYQKNEALLNEWRTRLYFNEKFEDLENETALLHVSFKHSKDGVPLNGFFEYQKKEVRNMELKDVKHETLPNYSSGYLENLWCQQAAKAVTSSLAPSTPQQHSTTSTSSHLHPFELHHHWYPTHYLELFMPQARSHWSSHRCQRTRELSVQQAN